MAKLSTGTYEDGKRTKTWLKYKNWKTVSCFISPRWMIITAISTLASGKIVKSIRLAPLSLGLDSETKSALKSTIRQNHYQREGNLLLVNPRNLP